MHSGEHGQCPSCAAIVRIYVYKHKRCNATATALVWERTVIIKLYTEIVAMCMCVCAYIYIYKYIHNIQYTMFVYSHSGARTQYYIRIVNNSSGEHEIWTKGG
jgi:hypothetical protein